MKTNLPITDNEIPFPKGEEIISTTSLKGVLNSFNDTFQQISGFEADELLHKNHNVVRHPQMPSAVFSDLWRSMKANHHWMGIIKNRAKNGDYYWVDGYISPIIDNGEVVGYESVRTEADRDRIERAERVYQRINAGKPAEDSNSINSLGLKGRFLLAQIIALLTAVILTSLLFGSAQPAMAIVAGIAVTAFWGLSFWAFMPLKAAGQQARKEIDNPLMAYIYTGRSDEIGQLLLATDFIRGRLNTTLSRMRQSSADIAKEADDSAHSIATIQTAVQQQAMQMEQVAAAMTEMTASIQEVASNAAYAAEKAQQTDELAANGNASASLAVGALSDLGNAIRDISSVVTQLDNDTRNISQIINVITDIADQTNLLALNAAIEAARAGEHGRGFAVVAEEVRSLASKTQLSTQQIQNLISELNNAVKQAISVMELSQKTSKNSEQHVNSAIKSLETIANEVSTMNSLNAQIATAVEQQSTVSEGINRNIVNVNESASQVSQGAEGADTAAQKLSRQSHHLTDMIKRFQQS